MSSTTSYKARVRTNQCERDGQRKMAQLEKDFKSSMDQLRHSEWELRNSMVVYSEHVKDIKRRRFGSSEPKPELMSDMSELHVRAKRIPKKVNRRKLSVTLRAKSDSNPSLSKTRDVDPIDRNGDIRRLHTVIPPLKQQLPMKLARASDLEEVRDELSLLHSKTADTGAEAGADHEDVGYRITTVLEAECDKNYKGQTQDVDLLDQGTAVVADAGVDDARNVVMPEQRRTKALLRTAIETLQLIEQRQMNRKEAWTIRHSGLRKRKKHLLPPIPKKSLEAIPEDEHEPLHGDAMTHSRTADGVSSEDSGLWISSLMPRTVSKTPKNKEQHRLISQIPTLPALTELKEDCDLQAEQSKPRLEPIVIPPYHTQTNTNVDKHKRNGARSEGLTKRGKRRQKQTKLSFLKEHE